MKFKSWNVEMFGLVVLFCLFVWLLLTLLAMHIGKRIAMRFGKSKNAGRFWGFMFAMGWVYCLWAFQFVGTAAVAYYHCQKKAGIWVYITPEEWKTMRKLSGTVNKPVEKKIIFDGLEYEEPFKFETGMYVYSRDDHPFGSYASVRDYIFYDSLLQKPLYRTYSVYSFVYKDIPFGLANIFLAIEDLLPRCDYFKNERTRKLYSDFFES